VTKKEIVKRISERSGLTQMKTKEIVQWTFDAIIETLKTEKRIELRNFGVFEVKRREARKARNPKTNADVHVGPKNVVTFQPGKEMEDQIRQMPLVPPKPKKSRKKMLPGETNPSSAETPPSPNSDGAIGTASPVETAPTPAVVASGNGSSNGVGGEHAPVETGKKRKVRKEA
jgi:nucleoid DNA-binding protein